MKSAVSPKQSLKDKDASTFKSHLTSFVDKSVKTVRFHTFFNFHFNQMLTGRVSYEHYFVMRVLHIL